MATSAAPERDLYARLKGAMTEGLRLPRRRKRAGAPQAEKATQDLDRLGIYSVNAKSSAEDVQKYVDRLWHDQDDLLEERHREWRQHLLYVSNEQNIAYHRDRRTWIPKRTVPWRIRSIYNICAKAVNLRVGRLVENKPAVSVQAQTASRDDVEKAESKETLFWYLWERLQLHMKITRARRWAAKCGSGFLKVTYDADSGCSYPATKKRIRYEQTIGVDPATGAEIPQQVFAGVEEYYIDADGNDLGPLLMEEQGPTGEITYVKAPVPEDVAWLSEGEADVSVRSPFNVRWDRYEDDIADSWYVQDAEIQPMSRILGMWPDKMTELLEATPASEDDKALQWAGLTPRTANIDAGAISSSERYDADGEGFGQLDKEYLVLETWIYPRTPIVKKQWGEKGMVITTVGGIEVAREPLPEWALKAPNFVQLVDTLEEGNHYGKSFLRDIIPLQDDINRSRSMRAERLALLARLLLWAPKNAGLKVSQLANMTAALITTNTRDQKPEPLNLGAAEFGAREFEMDSIAAAADIGNMNDASTGKLPSAGLAAKAIYALQYADERSIAEASTLQDLSLKRLAEALDAVTRTEYSDARKIKVVGEDNAFMVEHEISPEDLRIDVDYTFQPGSMMSRQKEAVKNELLELKGQGLVDDATVRKHLASAVPDVFRTSYNLQEAKARRRLRKILRSPIPVAVQPDPYDDPAIGAGVLEEFLNSAKAELIGGQQKAVITQLWQSYKLMQAQQAAAMQQAAPGAPGAPGAPPQPKPGPAGKPEPTTPAGAQQQETAAKQMEPPKAFQEGAAA